MKISSSCTNDTAIETKKAEYLDCPLKETLEVFSKIKIPLKHLIYS
jgi:hypothetical protein